MNSVTVDKNVEIGYVNNIFELYNLIYSYIITHVNDKIDRIDFILDERCVKATFYSNNVFHGVEYFDLDIVEH